MEFGLRAVVSKAEIREASLANLHSQITRASDRSNPSGILAFRPNVIEIREYSSIATISLSSFPHRLFPVRFAYSSNITAMP